MADGADDDDFERFRRTRAPAALAAVFDRTAPDLLRVALHVCGRRADAEDALQATFVVAIEGADRWDRARGLFPWLVGILVRQAAAQRRANARTPDPARLAAVAIEDPQATARARELDDAVATALAQLDERYRPVVHLHLQHGLDGAQIAAALGRPHARVRQQLVRGLRRLRALMPAGFAVFGAMVLTGGRGIAAVRQAVLARASDGVSVATGAANAAKLMAATAGGAAMAKWLAATLAVLIALWLWSPWAPPSGVAPASGAGDGALVASAAGEREGDAKVAANTASNERADVSAAARVGSLRVHVLCAAVQRSRSFSMFGPGAAGVGFRVEVHRAEANEAEARVAVTDDTGDAVFDDLPIGAWSVRCPVIEQAQRVQVAASAAAQLTFTHSIAGTVRGRVVDEDGRAIAGAELWLCSGLRGNGDVPAEMAMERWLRRAAVSAADGSFAVPFAARETLSAHCTGFAPSRAVHLRDAIATPITLVLGREPATVEGTVVDERGAPVPDAMVSVRTRDQKYHLAIDGVPTAGGGPQSARSDTHGRFAFAALRPGPVAVSAVLGMQRAADVAVDLAPSGRASALLRLAPARTVRGSLRRPDGSPAWCVFVRALDAADRGRELASRQVQSDGTFALPVDTAAAFVVVADEPNVGHSERAYAPPLRWPIVGCDLQLRPEGGVARELRGRVLDADERPFAEVYVNVLDANGKPGVGASMQPDATFVLRGLGAGRARIGVMVPGGSWAQPSALVEVDPDVEHDIVLRIARADMPTASLRARIVDDLGAAVANASGWAGSEDGVSLQIGVDEHGELHLDHLPEGVAAFSLGATEAHADTTWHIPPLAAHEARDLGTLRMPRAGALRIECVRVDGSPWNGPLPAIEVHDAAEHDTSGIWNTNNERDGRVVRMLTGLAPGDYRVAVTEPDVLAEPVTATVAAGGSVTVRLLLAVGRTVTFAFGDADAGTASSQPLRVEAVDAVGAIVRAATITAGSAWTVTLPFGAFAIRARDDNAVRYAARLTLGSLDDPTSVTVPPVAR